MNDLLHNFTSALYPYGILPYFTGFTLIILSFNLILKGAKKKAARASFILCISIAAWILTGGILMPVKDVNTASLLKDIYFAFWLMIPLVTLYLASALSEKKVILLYVYSAVSIALIVSNIVFDLSILNKGYFGYYSTFIYPMNYIGNIYYFLCTGTALVHLYRTYLNSVETIKRNQLRLLWAGISAGFMASVTESILVLSEKTIPLDGNISFNFVAINILIMITVTLSYLFLIMLVKQSEKKNGLKALVFLKKPLWLTLFMLPVTVFLTWLLIHFSYPMYTFKETGIAVSIFFVSYAILKYRFVDITELFRKYFVYVFLSLVFMGLFFMLLSSIVTDPETAFYIMLFTLIFILLFNPLHIFFQRIINSYFFGDRLNYQETLKQVSAKLVTLLDYDDLIKEIDNAITAHLNTSSYALIIYDHDMDSYSTAAFSGLDENDVKGLWPSSHPFINLIRLANREIFREEVDGSDGVSSCSEMCEFFVKFRSLLLVPVSYNGRLRGIFFLGEKISGEIYTPTDISLLTIMGNQLSIALENARLYELATRDGLTRLYLSRFFHQRLIEEIFLSIRQGRPVSMLMIDIDFFKSVNDTYGHQAGDSILKEIAGVILEQVRMIDIVARYGGEEFAVILPEAENQMAFTIAERIRGAVEKQEFTGNIKNTVSIGVATLDGVSLRKTGSVASWDSRTGREDIAGDIRTQLIKRADEALYSAKNSGRNRCENGGIEKAGTEINS